MLSRSFTIGVLLLLSSIQLSYGQDSLRTFYPGRFYSLAAAGAVIAGGSLTALQLAWYDNYERQPFTFFNDNDQWLQMDKVGHGLTAYYLTKVCHQSLRWSGAREQRALWYGAGVGYAYLTAIELMDAHAFGWGFSTGDMIANTGGTALYLAQELTWGEQRLRMKFNFLPTEYATYRPEVFGVGFWQQMLKDYNGQCYWLTSNPNDWTDVHWWPRWLDLAAGYSASGMTGGGENRFPLLDSGAKAPDFERVRQYYLSLDINLDALPAKRNWFKAFKSVFGFIKLPAPAIGIDSGGRLIGGIR